MAEMFAAEVKNYEGAAVLLLYALCHSIAQKTTTASHSITQHFNLP
jgi:hypothetical protein